MSLSLKQHRDRNQQSGFSTLEAMVAIAILSIALLPLYSFQNLIVSGTSRVEANLDAQAKHELATTYLRGLVPSGLGQEAATLGELELRWSVDVVHPARDALTSSGLPGRFNMSLVRIAYTIEAPSQQGELLGNIERTMWTETSSIFSNFDP
ncbi:MAG: hypothetical protein Hens2KO_22040 [Henriciella sp.]